MNECRSCGADVLWSTTAATGKPIPLDAEPNPAGNVVLDDAGRAVIVPPDGLEAEAARANDRLYMPHHATCPHGRAWRRPSKPTDERSTK